MRRCPLIQGYSFRGFLFNIQLLPVVKAKTSWSGLHFTHVIPDSIVPTHSNMSLSSFHSNISPCDVMIETHSSSKRYSIDIISHPLTSTEFLIWEWESRKLLWCHIQTNTKFKREEEEYFAAILHNKRIFDGT